MRTSVLVVLVFLIAAASADGQVVAIHPANPSSLDSITIDVAKPNLDYSVRSIEVVGTEIRITFAGYLTTPAFGLVPVPIGRLAPGSYSIVVTFVSEDVFGNPISTFSEAPVPLQVSLGNVPTMDDATLLVFALALSATALWILPRSR